MDEIKEIKRIPYLQLLDLGFKEYVSPGLYMKREGNKRYWIDYRKDQVEYLAKGTKNFLDPDNQQLFKIVKKITKIMKFDEKMSINDIIKSKYDVIIKKREGMDYIND